MSRGYAIAWFVACLMLTGVLVWRGVPFGVAVFGGVFAACCAYVFGITD